MTPEGSKYFVCLCHFIQYCVTALGLYCHSCYVFKGLRSSNQRSPLCPICWGDGGYIFVMYEITSLRLTLERKMSCVNIVNMGPSVDQPFSPSISHTMALYNGVYPTGKQSSPICPDR